MINRQNYLHLREYLIYQDEVMQRDPKSVRVLKQDFKHLLRWADDHSFAAAPAIRPVFPRYLQTVGLTPTGVRRICQGARRFLHWLIQTYSREFKTLPPAWVDTLQPPRMDALPRRERQIVTLDMVRQLLQIPHDHHDVALRRDKAAAAFLFLSGMRATAFCTLPLTCVDMPGRVVRQFPTLGVRTKNRKAIITRLLEIPDLLQVCEEWDTFLREQLPPHGLWYPVIDISCGEQRLTADAPGQFRGKGLGDNLRALFKAAQLPLMSPHDFRHGHATYALQMAKDIADLKAVSMNLGHSSLTITDAIYAVLSDQDMEARIAKLGQHGNKALSAELEIAEIVRQVIGEISKRQ